MRLNLESIQPVSCFCELKSLKDNQLTIIGILGILAIGSIVFLINQNFKLKNKIQDLNKEIIDKEELKRLNAVFRKLESRCSMIEKIIKIYQESNKK